MSDNDDFDAPEEFSYLQAIQQDEELTKVQHKSEARILRECKERRRKWSQRKKPRTKPQVVASESEGKDEHELEYETPKEPQYNGGMLPSDIVNLLVASEKQVFLSDSEEEKNDKNPKQKKKRPKKSGVEPVVLNNIAAAPCLQSSIEFLKKRKMQVPRSNAVLKNSNRALRLMSSSGLLK